MSDFTDRLNERADLEAELTAPQAQTAGWKTDDGRFLVRKYGDVMTICESIGPSRWGPEFALVAEAWDFGASA